MVSRPRALSRSRAARALAGGVALAGLGMLVACGARTVPPPPPAPLYPAFEYPALLAPLAGVPAAAVARHDEGWRLLQAGQLRAAARAFTDVLTISPAFYPARAGLGYVELANREYQAAASAFAAALAQQPGYLPALAGRADALIAANQALDAIPALEALVAADPSRAAARTRLETLRLSAIESLVAEAGAARQRGDFEMARERWTRAVAASPESAFMLRELAVLERQTNRLDDAYTHATAATALDDQDAAGHALVGEIELARGRLGPALEAFRRAEARGARGEYASRIAEVEKRIDFAAMPDAFRAIRTSPIVTRADVAALLGVRLEAWLASAPPAAVSLMTDVRGHWAQRWILKVTQAGLMDAFPNHTFQPGQLVRRADLARIISRAIERASEIDPRIGRRLPAPAVSIADVPETNDVRPAVTTAVAAGVLAVDEQGNFGPARAVSGADATAAVERLAVLLERP